MRRLRRTKIVATLGPASSERAVIAQLFEAGADVFRINMSHTSHDAHARTGRDDPLDRAANLAGRSASWSICRDPKLRLGTFGGGSAMVNKGDTLRPRFAIRARRHDACPPAASGNPASRSSPARRCCSTTARCGCAAPSTEPDATAPRGSRSAASSRIARASACPRPCCRFRRCDQGPLRSRSRARCRHRLARAVLHAAARGHRGGQEDHARTRRGHGQDREAAGGRAARRDHGTCPTR